MKKLLVSILFVSLLPAQRPLTKLSVVTVNHEGRSAVSGVYVHVVGLPEIVRSNDEGVASFGNSSVDLPWKFGDKIQITVASPRIYPYQRDIQLPNRVDPPVRHGGKLGDWLDKVNRNYTATVMVELKSGNAPEACEYKTEVNRQVELDCNEGPSVGSIAVYCGKPVGQATVATGQIITRKTMASDKWGASGNGEAVAGSLGFELGEETSTSTEVTSRIARTVSLTDLPELPRDVCGDIHMRLRVTELVLDYYRFCPGRDRDWRYIQRDFLKIPTSFCIDVSQLVDCPSKCK